MKKISEEICICYNEYKISQNKTALKNAIKERIYSVKICIPNRTYKIVPFCLISLVKIASLLGIRSHFSRKKFVQKRFKNVKLLSGKM